MRVASSRPSVVSRNQFSAGQLRPHQNTPKSSVGRGRRSQGFRDSRSDFEQSPVEDAPGNPHLPGCVTDRETRCSKGERTLDVQLQGFPTDSNTSPLRSLDAMGDSFPKPLTLQSRARPWLRASRQSRGIEAAQSVFESPTPASGSEEPHAATIGPSATGVIREMTAGIACSPSPTLIPPYRGGVPVSSAQIPSIARSTIPPIAPRITPR